MTTFSYSLPGPLSPEAAPTAIPGIAEVDAIIADARTAQVAHTAVTVPETGYVVPGAEVRPPDSELLNGIHEPIPKGTDVTGKIVTPNVLREARLLVADVYEAWGYIKAEDRDEAGYINAAQDPHVADSNYYARVRNGEVVATVRLIKKESIADFPALAEFDVSPNKLRAVNDDSTLFREVSALAKRPQVGHRNDVLGVYAGAMKDTIEEGGRYWLMSADTRLAGKLKQLFGRKSFTELGDEKFVMGSPTLPMLLDVHKALHLLDKPFVPADIKNIFKEGLRGVDASSMNLKTQRVLARHGIIDGESLPPRKLITGKRLATAGLAAYAFSRAGVIPATSINDDGVNPAVFLGLDVATIPTYIEGLARFTDKGTIARKAGGLALAAASFAAPYAYVYSEAQDSSKLPETFGAFGAMLVGAIGIKKAWTMYRARKDGAVQPPTS